MSTALNVKVGFAMLSNEDCSVHSYRLGADPDQLLYGFVKHCLSQKEDLCTNRAKYSVSPIHEKVITELCDANR